jgi:hypothetical protein
MPSFNIGYRTSVVLCAGSFALLFACAAASTGSLWSESQQKSTSPAAAPSRELEFAVRGDMFAGMAGDTTAFDRAMKACDVALAADPKNAVALVWHATGMYFRSSLAFRSGDVAGGNSLREQARKEMDEGVALRPNSVDILIPRATVLQMQAAHTPDAQIAKRVWQRSTDDFEKAVQLQADGFDKLPVHSRGELLGGLAEGYAGLGDSTKARAYLTRLTKEMSDTLYGQKAKTLLAADSLPRPLGVTCIGCHVDYKK